MVGDGRCCKLFVFRGDRRSACGDIRQSGQLAYLFFCLFVFCVCVSAGYFVSDILGVGWLRAMKFCRTVDLGVRQVISPFGELCRSG